MSQATTLYVIAYDIPDDKRRTKVHKLLSAYGQWTQYSLFECFLSRLQRIELMHQLQLLLDPQTDSLRFYLLCDACAERVQTVGGQPPQEPTIFLL
jgi:CRISPR-associated protein Cas2